MRDVDCSGMGCLLTRAEAWHRHMPRTLGANNSREWLWHDVAWTMNVKKAGWKWRLHYGVKARHWHTAGDGEEGSV